MKYLSVLLFICAYSYSCTPTRYFTDTLPESDIPTFISFNVEDHCDEDVNPIMAIRLDNAVKKRLMQKGYRLSSTPDIIVKAYLKHNDKMYIEPCSHFDRWEGGMYCQTKFINYEEGTVIIDLINTNTNTIFWHGAATGTAFNQMSNPNDDIQRIVDELFNRLFKKG